MEYLDAKYIYIFFLFSPVVERCSLLCRSVVKVEKCLDKSFLGFFYCFLLFIILLICNFRKKTHINVPKSFIWPVHLVKWAPQWAVVLCYTSIEWTLESQASHLICPPSKLNYQLLAVERKKTERDKSEIPSRVRLFSWIASKGKVIKSSEDVIGKENSVSEAVGVWCLQLIRPAWVCVCVCVYIAVTDVPLCGGRWDLCCAFVTSAASRSSLTFWEISLF